MPSTSLSRRRLMQLLAISMAGTTVLKQDVFASIPEDATSYDDANPVFIPAGSGKQGKIGEGDIIFKLNKSQTSNLLGSTESVLLPGILGAPPHYHKGFDEICRVLEGAITIMVGKELFDVKAGDWHLRPKGVVHTFWNAGKVPAKFIELYVPGGHEAYMNDLADMFINNARPAPGALDKLATKYDIIFDWPKLKEIMDTYQVQL